MLYGEGSTTIAASSVTYGGQTMTKVAEKSYSNGASSYTGAFILNEAGVAAASSGAIAVQWSSAPKSGSEIVSAFLSGVDPTALVGAVATGSIVGKTVTTAALATAAGDMVITAGTAANNASYTINNGFTRGIPETSASFGDITSAYKEATGADETPSLMSSSSQRQTMVGFVVKAGKRGSQLEMRSDYNALVLIYDPFLSSRWGGKRVNEYFGWNNVDTLLNQYITALKKYSGNNATWHVAQRYNLNEFPPNYPTATPHTPDNFPDNVRSENPICLSGDYHAIINDPRFNIIPLVEAGQIDAVWIFFSHHTGFCETAMAGEGAFSVNGLVSGVNCSKKFVFYGFNYSRDVGCMLENTAHYSEFLLLQVARNWPLKWRYDVWNDYNVRNPERGLTSRYLNDWQRYMLTDQANMWKAPTSDFLASPGNANVGSCHYSTNSSCDYAWGGLVEEFNWGQGNFTNYTGTWDASAHENHTIANPCAKSFACGIPWWSGTKTDTIDMVFKDYTCEGDVRLANEAISSNAGFMFRINNFSVTPNSGTGYYAGINAATDRVVLAKLNNGYTELASAPFTAVVNTTYHMKIIAIGSSIKVYVNNMGVPLLSVSDASYEAGAFACAAYNAEAWFDNINLNPSVSSYCNAWFNYPDLSAPARVINCDDFGGNQAGWMCYFFEHIPKNPGEHNDVDVTTGKQYTGILNNFWPYLFDINRFDKSTGYSDVTFLPKDTQAPQAVLNPSATATSGSTITLSWGEPADNVGVTRYEITRNGSAPRVLWKPPYTDKSLTPATAYSYTIKARDACGNLSAGVTVNAVTRAQ